MSLRLYNTLGHEKQDFAPQDGNTATFYACGPTVYHYAHLGNLRAYVFMDILRRALTFNGFDVNLVVNITDVGHLTDDADQGEDKMEKGAARENKSVWEIAEYYTKVFKQDLAHLNILDPSRWVVATEHIQEMIDLVKKIEANGYAYETSDGVYFDTSKLDDYGVLVENFDPSQLEAGKRVEMGDKRNPTDFALWKFSPQDEQRQMEWDSPWGVGFPGWHVECTAMACEHLGEVFDIHTGGIDHIPVHHTNEIAQAQGAFGHNHARFWLHSEFLVDKGGKMSKSKGDFLRLQTVLDEGFDALDYRYFCLLTHYRKPLTFSWDALKAARTARMRLTQKAIDLKERAQPAASMSDERLDYQGRFASAINDDLNTPEALGVLNEMMKSDLPDAQKLSLVLDFNNVLGLGLDRAARDVVDVPEDVQLLVEDREAAREAKDFEKADALRERIREKGWVVSDTDEGPVVSPAGAR